MEGYDPRRPPNVRVTVLEDPNNSLQELFNPASQKQQVPLHQRKLPKSFFVPPGETNDSSRFCNLNSLQSSDFVSSGFVIAHSKANSSPACLDAALRASISSHTPAHGHQKSLDVGSKYTHAFCPDLNFESFCNRDFIQVSRDSQTNPIICRPAMGFAISDLPAGFDLAINENNQVYFLNHQTQDTTWFDPRIPEKYQKWGMTLEELEQVHINYAKQFLCGSPDPNLSVCGQRTDRVSPSSPAICTPTSPTSNMLQVQSGIPNVIAISSAAGPSIQTIPSSPASPQSASTPNPNLPTLKQQQQTGNRLRLPNRSHPTQLPHSPHTHQTHDHLQSPGIPQHHRQHSQGLLTQSQAPVEQTLIAHFRSCSQPVSMSTCRDGLQNTNEFITSSPLSNTDGISSLCHSTQLRMFGSVNCGVGDTNLLTNTGSNQCPRLLGTATSNTTLSGNTNMDNSNNTSNNNLQRQLINPVVTSSSSGQLVQGLECLKLNNTNSTNNATSSAALVLDAQTKSLQQQFLLSAQSPNLLIGSNLTNLGLSRLINTVLPNSVTTGTATQHSHQSSMDSGVGQSLTGQSNASANQTPEHAIMLFCDPSLSGCNTERMEGISYPTEELTGTNFNVFDNIDISDISA